MSEVKHGWNQTAVVLFDGHCNLCNKSVQFILEREKDSTLLFTSLQSDAGRQILEQHGFPVDYRDSVLFLEKEKLYVESAAALRIANYLKAPWSWLRVFWIVPSFLRNFVYRFIAKRRLKWFGSTDSCWVMCQEWRERFLL